MPPSSRPKNFTSRHPALLTASLLILAVAVLALAGIVLSGAQFNKNPALSKSYLDPAATLFNQITQYGLNSPSASVGSSLKLYFTNPGSVTNAKRSGGVDEPLAQAIRRARVSVDMAAYNLTHPSIRDALLEAHQKGVRVRLVMESDNMDTQTVDALKEAGIPILGDRHEGLMHNKFLVIDNKEVWTGSMNFTVSGAYTDNNNIIRLRSTRVAQDYTTEFEEMFIGDHFGPDTVLATPFPELQLGGGIIEVYFSPDDGISKRLVDLINSAGTSVYFLAYSFTSDDIAQAMTARYQSGVKVSGVFDASQVESNIGTEYPGFRKLAMDVHRDGNTGLMHHKVIIIDSSIVILGSYNFSANAEDTNDENLLILHYPKLAKAFIEEFERIHALAEP